MQAAPPDLLTHVLTCALPPCRCVRRLSAKAAACVRCRDRDGGGQAARCHRRDPRRERLLHNCILPQQSDRLSRAGAAR